MSVKLLDKLLQQSIRSIRFDRSKKKFLFDPLNFSLSSFSYKEKLIFDYPEKSITWNSILFHQQILLLESNITLGQSDSKFARVEKVLFPKGVTLKGLTEASYRNGYKPGLKCNIYLIKSPVLVNVSIDTKPFILSCLHY